MVREFVAIVCGAIGLAEHENYLPRREALRCDGGAAADHFFTLASTCARLKLGFGKPHRRHFSSSGQFLVVHCGHGSKLARYRLERSREYFQ